MRPCDLQLHDHRAAIPTGPVQEAFRRAGGPAGPHRAVPHHGTQSAAAAGLPGGRHGGHFLSHL